MSDDRTRALLALLDFYREAGADALVQDAPWDRLAPEPPVGDDRPALAEPSPSYAHSSPKLAPALPGAQEAVLSAREAAQAATTLDELRNALNAFDGCALKFGATQLVFGDGLPNARLMIVGEAPGRDEDLAGVPFVGKSGKLLDRMLAAIGLVRADAYIANIVPWRPPSNRTPTPVESQTCLPFLQRQIELVAPELLVTLGSPSTQTLLRVTDGITKTRGRRYPLTVGAHSLTVMPTFHPAFLLRSPLQKRLVWRDLLAIKAALAGAHQA